MSILCWFPGLGGLLTVTRITASWAEKYGYNSAEEFIKNAQKKFSLVETGVMDQPNCRLLMLNVSPRDLENLAWC